jgi:hypothetical protein
MRIDPSPPVPWAQNPSMWSALYSQCQNIYETKRDTYIPGDPSWAMIIQ